MRNLILSALLVIAQAAAAAECGNCQGYPVVGDGPVRIACPVCLGTGTVADPEPVAAARAAPGRPRPVVVRITAADGPSRISGSGVLVEVSGTAATLLTNWHVVRTHREGLTVAWPDGTKTAGRVLAYDAEWDLAAVQVPRPAAAEPVAITASAPRLGDRLTIAGYGPEGRYLEQTGPVTDYGSPSRGAPQQIVEMKASARQGDSGGPMFNAAGELAGVLFGERSGFTVGSCSTRLRTFLAETKAAVAARPDVSAAQCCDGRCAR